ncbi:MAG: O-antigen ligase family protein [Nitrospirota bacterium]
MINLNWVKERLIVFLLVLLIFLPPTFLSGGYTFGSLILIESLILLAGLIWSWGRIKIIKSSLTLPILFYITTCLLSTLNSHYLRGSWEELIKLACGIIFFLMVGNYFTCRLKLLVYTFILTTLIVISLSLTQFFMHLPESLIARLYYPLGNPNILGGFLAITIPLMLRILFVSPETKLNSPQRHRVHGEEIQSFNKSFILCVLRASVVHIFLYFQAKFKFLLGILLLFSFMTLYLSYSKGATLGIIIAILFLFSLNLYNPLSRGGRGCVSSKRGKIPVLLLCLSIGFVLFIIYISAGIWEHSFSQRVPIWKNSWQMFLDHPILGIGLGAYPNVYFDYKGNEFWHLHSHNIFLQYACEMGITGLVSFIWLIITLFKVNLKNTGDNYERAVREGLLAGMVAFLIQAQVDYLLWIPMFQLYFWLILGVLSYRKGGNTPPTPSREGIIVEGEYVSKASQASFSRPLPIIIILFWVFCVLKPWLGYISFNQGVDLADKGTGSPGKWQEAKIKFESAVLLDFYHPVYHTHLGTTYTRIQPPDLSSAIKEYEIATQVDNYNRSDYYNLSQLYYQKGDFLKAQKALLRAIKLERVSYKKPVWIDNREEFIHKANSFYAKMFKLNDEKKKNTLSWILYRREPMLELKVSRGEK